MESEMATFPQPSLLFGKGDTCASTSSPNFCVAPVGGHLTLTNLMCTSPAYMVVLWWNRVPNLEPSDPEAKTLPPGHCSPPNCESKFNF
ncbi:hypothetical protein AVEN_74864-1 [Araneus ventricosus]|uniref:Uncharacterized protein n=1 Tax=Araneus ventricosus TaxID=182803 RepID=A0A4Y2U8G1_ARAVE|nr:hypothetical protein AVEN_85469-1 [Araneus ventricosus]GBO07850.1 hypothetical protein AVEN_112944-1 [Araneus ventricosus]GBO07897.1 hypothetical protein AVEN_191354-1 [Araneus ventricosus]GBO07936.1 hypothetical protein AVEN_74864-1 [Araneus ventricosus]